MKIRKLLLSLSPLAIIPSFIGVANCSLIERINQLPKQMDGLDWIGRIDGLFTKNDYYVDTDDQTVTYWNSTGITAHDLVVPNYVWYKGKKFKVILDEQCFWKCTGISGTLELNDWVTDIPASCFQECINIEHLILHNYPTSIGDDAFNGCSSLYDISVRKEDDTLDQEWTLDVESIGISAFVGTQIRGNLIFTNKLKEIGEDAFTGCFQITSVDLEFCTELEVVGAWSFAGCTGITDIYLPKSITKIDNGAFQQCSELVNVHLPSDGENMIIELGDNAFYKCTKFQTFIPVTPTVKTIGMNCFYDNKALSYEPWTESKNQGLVIGAAAFGSCPFGKIEIKPEIVKNVKNGAFLDCTNLNEIDFSSWGAEYATKPPAWEGLHIFQSARSTGTIVISKEISTGAEYAEPNSYWKPFFDQFRDQIGIKDEWEFAFKS